MNTSQNGSVLLLEDDEGLALLIRRNLERIGYSVIWLQTAQATPLAESFDVAILDYRLKGDLNGLDFYRNLCASAGKRVAAILITGFSDEKVLVDALRLGVRDFVPKNQGFLNVLPLLVERIMDEVHLERRRIEDERNLHAQSEVIEALQAINVGYLNIQFSNNTILWPEDVYPLVGKGSHSIRYFYRKFLKTITPDERGRIKAEIFEAIRNKRPFEISFQQHDSGKWFRLKGRLESTEMRGKQPRLLMLDGMLWEETSERENQIKLARSLEDLEVVTERLRVSMMEIHHRVKNSFQIVRSLLNMEFRKKGSLDKSSVAKVIAYIQGLGSIHDILTDTLRVDDYTDGVSVCMLVERIVTLTMASDDQQAIDVRCEDGLHITARVASSLAVIVSELLMNALKYGSGEIKLAIVVDGEERALLTLSNTIAALEREGELIDTKGTGFPLISFLTKSDFRGMFLTEITESNQFIAKLDFPLMKGAVSSAALV